MRDHSSWAWHLRCVCLGCMSTSARGSLTHKSRSRTTQHSWALPPLPHPALPRSRTGSIYIVAQQEAGPARGAALLQGTASRLLQVPWVLEGQAVPLGSPPCLLLGRTLGFLFCSVVGARSRVWQAWQERAVRQEGLPFVESEFPVNKALQFVSQNSRCMSHLGDGNRKSSCGC